MSTTTMGLWARLGGTAGDRRTATKGTVRRILKAMIAAREAEARRHAAQYLSYLPDNRLVELGMSAQDIQLMRDTGRIPPNFGA